MRVARAARVAMVPEACLADLCTVLGAGLIPVTVLGAELSVVKRQQAIVGAG